MFVKRLDLLLLYISVKDTFLLSYLFLNPRLKLFRIEQMESYGQFSILAKVNISFRWPCTICVVCCDAPKAAFLIERRFHQEPISWALCIGLEICCRGRLEYVIWQLDKWHLRSLGWLWCWIWSWWCQFQLVIRRQGPLLCIFDRVCDNWVFAVQTHALLSWAAQMRVWHSLLDHFLCQADVSLLFGCRVERVLFDDNFLRWLLSTKVFFESRLHCFLDNEGFACAIVIYELTTHFCLVNPCFYGHASQPWSWSLWRGFHLDI